MATLDNATVRYKFGSVYRIYEPAVDEVIQKFDTSLGQDAVCSYDDRNYVFNLSCEAENGDATFAALVDIVVGVIDRETQRGLITNGPKIGMIEGLAVEGTAAGSEMPEELDGTSSSVVSGVDDLIDIDITYAWQPHYGGTAFISSLKTRAQDLTAIISELTDCVVQIGESNREMIIKGHGTEVVGRAAGKLDNLERDFFRDYLSISRHFVEPEDENEVRARMIAATKLRDQTLHTTLTDAEKAFIEHKTFLEAVPSLCVLRIPSMAQGNSAPSPRPVALGPPSTMSTSSLWNHIRHKSVGTGTISGLPVWMEKTASREGTTMLGQTQYLTVADKNSQVEQWVEEGAREAKAGNIPLLSTGAGEIDSESAQSVVDDGDSLIDLTTGVYGPRSAAESVSGIRGPAASSPDFRPIAAPQRKKKYGRVLKPETKKPMEVEPTTLLPSQPLGTASPGEESSQKSWTQPRPSRTVSARTVQPAAPVAARGLNIFDLLAESNMDDEVEQDDESTATLTYSEEVKSSHLDDLIGVSMDPVAEEPVGDLLLDDDTLEAQHSAVTSPTIPSIWDSGTLADRHRTLLDSDLPHDLREALPTAINGDGEHSTFGETSTITAGYTNGQIANGHVRDFDEMDPPESAPVGWEVAFGEPTLLSDIQSTVVEMLELAQSHRGKLEFKVDIGRIFMSNVPKEAKKNFDLQKWQEVVFASNAESCPLEGFANMVSSSSADVEFIVGLKDTEGSRMFSDEVHSHRIAYEFHCVDGEGNNVVIEMDADTLDHKIVSRTKAFGSAYIHYPNRSWDARLTLVGSSYVATHPSATGLVDTLFIPTVPDPSPTGATPPFELYALLPSPPLPVKRFRIDAVTTKRIARHASLVSPTTFLSITEMCDLVIQRHPRIPGGIRAVAHARAADMAVAADGSCRLWYEVGVVDGRVDEALKENETLELGEDAAWVAEEVVAGLAGMWEVVDGVVKGCEQVGAGNWGMVARRRKRQRQEAAGVVGTAGGDAPAQKQEAVEFW